jgi:hypothetical protein
MGGGQPSDGEQQPKQGGQTQDNRQEQGQKDPGQEPQDQQTADGEDPRGNREDQGEPETRPAAQSPDQETQDPRAPGAGTEQWGNLPIHLRELFRAEGGTRLPARYRDWIDSYYRRLNRRSGG